MANKDIKRREKYLIENYGSVYEQIHTEELIKQKQGVKTILKITGAFSVVSIILTFTFTEFIGALIEPIAQTLLSEEIKNFICRELHVTKFCPSIDSLKQK